MHDNLWSPDSAPPSLEGRLEDGGAGASRAQALVVVLAGDLRAVVAFVARVRAVVVFAAVVLAAAVGQV